MKKPLSEQMQKLMDRRKRAVGKGFETQARTNGDHIRAMSDEDLAEWLENVDCFNCECCVHQMACRFEHDAETVYYEDKYDCRVGRMDWLKQPYKEEA